MIISKTDTGKHIYTSWREGREKRQKIVEFTPYFYILSSDNQPKYYNPSKFVKREETKSERPSVGFCSRGAISPAGPGLPSLPYLRYV